MENTLRKYRAPLFADWGSDVSAALDYVAQLSSASVEGPAINTATRVVLNTVINAVDKMLASSSPEKLATLMRQLFGAAEAPRAAAPASTASTAIAPAVPTLTVSGIPNATNSGHAAMISTKPKRPVSRPGSAISRESAGGRGRGRGGRGGGRGGAGDSSDRQNRPRLDDRVFGMNLTELFADADGPCPAHPNDTSHTKIMCGAFSRIQKVMEQAAKVKKPYVPNASVHK